VKLTFFKRFDQLLPADEATFAWYASLDADEYVVIEVPAHTRTSKQNSAIRVYCRNVADTLNDAGFDMQSFPWKEGFKLPWSDYTVMEFLWRKIQEAMTGKHSTTKLETQEVNQVYEVLSQKLSEAAGISVPFPSKSNGD